MCNCNRPTGNCNCNPCRTTTIRYRGAEIPCVGINTNDPFEAVINKLADFACGIDGLDGVGIDSIVGNGDGTFTINLSNGTSWTSDDLTGPQGIQGIPGVQGLIGPQGQSIDHVSFTSTTGTAQGQPGETDTYTVWGDVLETINLGTFVVTNGTNPEVKTEYVAIGDWDMDTSGQVVVPLSPLSKFPSNMIVTGIDVVILPDDGGATQLRYSLDRAGFLERIFFAAPFWQVILERDAAGFFDSASFSATSFNRGYVTVHYFIP
jgi:hypothetical protein